MDFNPVGFIAFLFFIFTLYLIYKVLTRDNIKKNNQEELFLLDADDAHDLAIEYNKKYFLIAHKNSMKHIVEGIKE
ncbi:MAG: hypothetical protein HXK68_05610, partial [Clostridiales bacterium]|nr:hypothetical protein [Clostridiales bacterium]